MKPKTTVKFAWTRSLFNCHNIIHIFHLRAKIATPSKLVFVLFLWGVQKPLSKFPKVFERLRKIILDVQIHKICRKKRKVIFEVFERCALTDQKFRFFLCLFFGSMKRRSYHMTLSSHEFNCLSTPFEFSSPTDSYFSQKKHMLFLWQLYKNRVGSALSR